MEALHQIKICGSAMPPPGLGERVMQRKYYQEVLIGRVSADERFHKLKLRERGETGHEGEGFSDQERKGDKRRPRSGEEGKRKAYEAVRKAYNAPSRCIDVCVCVWHAK